MKPIEKPTRAEQLQLVSDMVLRNQILKALKAKDRVLKIKDFQRKSNCKFKRRCKQPMVKRLAEFYVFSHKQPINVR